MNVGRFDLSKGLFFVAGPCLVEGEEMLRRVAGVLAESSARRGVALVLKGSFRKANRTAPDSFQTIGVERALEILASIGSEFELPTITDIHVPDDARLAADYVDILQIPAFLCRQTELLQAAAQTGRAVNVKKGQFMAPEDMGFAIDKVRREGNDRVMITERGTSFGYHNLVVDMRGLPIMRSFGAPVVYDATHSLQIPSRGGISGGFPEFIEPLVRGAVAVGVDGLFFETHPDPPSALSDAATQLPLERADRLIAVALSVHECVASLEKEGA